ncbi:MAG: TolC family protein [Bacteroidales bacterium]|nr:TolC family protein [Bacteroidales bacterium]
MNTGKIIITICLLASISFASAQEVQKNWTLRNCIDYALANNIQIKKMQVGVKVNEAGYEESKAALFPSLNASAGESFTHQKANEGDLNGQSSYFSNNYSLRSDVVLYNGSRLKNNIVQQDLSVKSANLSVDEARNSIELSVTTAYLQVLYAREAVINAENTLTGSEATRNRAKILLESGYIAESNYAQVQSQYSNDAYTLVNAKNNLELQMLSLKQLLELDGSTDLKLVFPEINDTQVLKVIPEKQQVYNTALGFMPEVENEKLNIQSADLAIKIAKAGYMPSLSLGASASTGQNSAVSDGYATQLGDNFYQNVGLTLSIPIFNNRQAKTAVQKATLNAQTARLSYAETEKNLRVQVESAYQDAIASQSRFQAAKEQLSATETSYKLVEDQFNLGMKNTVDLLTEKNKFLSAQQEFLQAKYSAVLNYKLLDFYQQKRIEL